MLLAAAAQEVVQRWDSPATLVPLIVSIVALTGAIFASLWAGRKTIKAEDKRHANGLVAEGVRHQNAIQAENLRAENAIKAEDRRHENALKQADVAWLRGARAKAYFGVIASTTQQLDAATTAAWFMRPRTDDDGKVLQPENPLAANPEGARAQIPLWNDARDRTAHMSAEIRAVGDPAIAELAERVSKLSGRVLSAVGPATKKYGAAFDPKKVGREDRKKGEAVFRELVEAIRQDLGAEHSNVGPVGTAPSGPISANVPEVAPAAQGD